RKTNHVSTVIRAERNQVLVGRFQMGIQTRIGSSPPLPLCAAFQVSCKVQQTENNNCDLLVPFACVLNQASQSRRKAFLKLLPLSLQTRFRVFEFARRTAPRPVDVVVP